MDGNLTFPKNFNVDCKVCSYLSFSYYFYVIFLLEEKNESGGESGAGRDRA